MLVESSGFEYVVFQSGTWSSGNLNGVIKGSQYKRDWFVHSIFSEALKRLLLTRFLSEVGFHLLSSFMNYHLLSSLFLKQLK